MTNEQQLADFAQNLKANQELLVALLKEIQAQGSVSQTLHHVIDFFVIALADIFAAGLVLVTLESWKEEDRAHAERANQVLNAIGPAIIHLLDKLPVQIRSMKLSPNTSFSMHWSDGSPLRAALRDPILARGSSSWEYPGGSKIRAALEFLRTETERMGSSQGGGAHADITRVLAAVQEIDRLRDEQLDTFVRGGTKQTWKRFFKWMRRRIPGATTAS